MSLIFSDMNSEGQDYSADVQMEAFVKWARDLPGPFLNAHISAQGAKVGYSRLAAYLVEGVEKNGHEVAGKWPGNRAADRLVQKLRKAGMLNLEGRQWVLTDRGENLFSEIAKDLENRASDTPEP